MTRYVKDISFVTSDAPVKGVLDMIDIDMNTGAGGKYIYPVLQYTENPNEAITGFAFVQNNQVVPHNFHKINQDLNEGAGGTFNYLCYTTVGNPKVTSVTFMALSDPLNVDQYDGYQVFRQDLSIGTRKFGKNVYLLYKTDKKM